MSSTSLIIYWKIVSSDSFFLIMKQWAIIPYPCSPYQEWFWVCINLSPQAPLFKAEAFLLICSSTDLLFTSDNYYFPSPYVLVVHSLFWEAASLSLKGTLTFHSFTMLINFLSILFFVFFLTIWLVWKSDSLLYILYQMSCKNFGHSCYLSCK